MSSSQKINNNFVPYKFGLQKSHLKAFTLLELNITLALIMIILLTSAPTLHDLLIKTRVTTRVITLKTALQLARSKAINLNTPIIICPSTNNHTCNNANWQNGYIITTMQGKVLYISNTLPNRDNLLWRSSMGKNTAITFLPSGTTNGQQGSFYYCPYNKNKFAKAIIIKQTGRIRISTKTATNQQIPCL